IRDRERTSPCSTTARWPTGSTARTVREEDRMKRWLTLLVLPLAALLILLAIVPDPVSGQGSQLNGLTRAVLQAGTFTLSGIYNFATGVRLPASTTIAPGSGGFLKKDADTGCWQEW